MGGGNGYFKPNTRCACQARRKDLAEEYGYIVGFGVFVSVDRCVNAGELCFLSRLKEFEHCASIIPKSNPVGVGPHPDCYRPLIRAYPPTINLRAWGRDKFSSRKHLTDR